MAQDDSSPPARTDLSCEDSIDKSVPLDGRVPPFPPHQGCAPLAEPKRNSCEPVLPEISRKIRFDDANIE